MTTSTPSCRWMLVLADEHKPNLHNALVRLRTSDPARDEALREARSRHPHDTVSALRLLLAADGVPCTTTHADPAALPEGKFCFYNGQPAATVEKGGSVA